MEFSTAYRIYKAQIEAFLRKISRQRSNYPATLKMAMEYSLLSGGKRLRPVLFISTFDRLFTGNMKEGLPMACAIEMIHTYSLMHDDLPCMDNDDYRRGKPTSHRVFGEGIAVLAGDALLNMAYEVLIENALKFPDNLKQHLKAISMIAHAAGANGMVGGQVADLQSLVESSNEEVINYIHTNKTAALIEVSLTAPAVLAGASEKELKAVGAYGKAIGMAFQITDDVLDHGKEDLSNECGNCCGKATYPSIFGVDESVKKAGTFIGQALNDITIFGEKGRFLEQIAGFVGKRQA